MTSSELREKWTKRLGEWRRLGASVSGAAICEEILADVQALEHDSPEDALTLSEAARISGYSADHLRHMIAAGELANLGRKHAPRVRRGDLPRKASASSAERLGAYDADGDALSIVRRAAGGSSR